ncbi:alpha/beta fold hydrolase [Neomesorhizobium albiziae]|uniref:alpha/beta fold hydrolase n=1 Tax=Neomesorhizobium albiziae TaxID=335020 RepID=UPI00122CEC2A|nr:alpha/beta fold hydrolase [Mesorhizobium albiziae]
MNQSLYALQSGQGPQTVVLLHGFGGCHGLWRPVQQALARDARVLAYDLPGHGGSLDWPEAGPAKVAVRAILADLEERGVDRFHIAGHSMGGAIAAMMALAAPSRVASLTLLAPGGFGEEINGRLLRRYAAATSEEQIRACLETMTGWPNPVPDEAVEALAEMRRHPGQTDKLVEIAASIARDGRQGVIAREKLAELPMPVAVVWGILDGVLPVHQANGLPPLFALHLIPAAGHMLPEEKPELVTEIIRRTMR